MTIAGLGWVCVAIWLAAVLALTIRKAPWGFATLLAVTPLYQFRGELGLPTTLLELTLGAVLFGWLINHKKYPLRPDRTWPWLGVMLAGSFIAALVSPDTREGLGLWRAFFLEPIAFYVTAAAVFKKEKTVALFYGLLGSLAVISTWSVIQAFGHGDLSYDGRLLGAYQSANFLALAVVPVIMAALFWPSQELPVDRARRLALRFVPAGIGVALLFASQSRGGCIALAFGLGVALLYNLRHFSRRQLIAMVATGVVLVGVAAPLLYHRNQTILPIRRMLAEHAMDYLADHPVFGVGPGQFQSRTAERYIGDAYYEHYFVPYAPNAHNFILVLWTEWGLAVLIATIGLLITVGERIKRIPRQWQILTIGSLGGMLIHGLVDVPILKNDLSILFMTVLMLAMVAPTTTARGRG